jgi:hypothetical protein
VKLLKAKVISVYKVKLEDRYHVKLESLSKELLAVKKLHRKHQDHEMKATSGLSSTSMWKVGMEIRK